MLTKCPVCLNEFNAIKSAKYCSEDCRKKARQTREGFHGVKKCEFCGKEFQPIRSTKKYCSALCFDKARWLKNHPKEVKKCEFCGKEILTAKSYKRFCSDTCRRKKMYRENIEKHREKRKEQYWKNPQEYREKTKEWRENNRDKFLETTKVCHNKARYGGNRERCFERDGYKCVMCGSVKQLIPHHKDGSGQTDNPNNALDNLETLCRKCHMAIHDPNPNKPNKVKRICEYCGAEFEVTPSRVKNGRGKYCSMDCRRAAGQ
jgi:Fe-S-cluster-containing dehydrogenase component